MNERIFELAGEAGLKVESWMTNPSKPFQILGSTEQFEKFAELIVQECAKFCEHESNDDEYDQYDMGMSVKAENIKTAIMKEFGVE